MKKLSVLEEIKDLRTVWTHEALEFTPWLSDEENIALLSDAIGIDITVDETESPVGDFNVDIFAFETGTDRKIIIENQLEDTNHDHLGKLITYAAGKSADLIIGDSQPAVKFEVVEKPNDWAKEIKKTTSATPTQQFRYEYWMAFNDYAFKNTEFAKNFTQRKATKDQWMDLSIGSSACHISISLIQKRNVINVAIYINDDKKLFQTLYGNKNNIEEQMDMELDWRELPDKKASRIIIEKMVDLSKHEKWTEQFDWIIDVALKMKKAFKKYL